MSTLKLHLAFDPGGETWTGDLTLIDLLEPKPELALHRAVALSLFCWRRAADDDQVLGGDRKGWWGDTYLGDDDQWGSRLWLLANRSLTNESLVEAEEYVREALEWLVADGVVGTIEVEVALGPGRRVEVEVVMTEPDPLVTETRYQDVWEAIRAAA